jgi:gliding motility-associated-like protein
MCGCVGDTVCLQIFFTQQYLPTSLDSVRWRVKKNGWNINIYEIDTVIYPVLFMQDTYYITPPIYYVFTDTFNTYQNASAVPFFEADVFVTENGVIGSWYLYAAIGNRIDCDIRYTGFRTDRRLICAGDCVNFADSSDRYPRHHRWYFEGATPNYSEERNPRDICYPTPGKYAVKHVVSNTVSSDSLTIQEYIEVRTAPSTPPNTLTEVEGFGGDTTTLTACTQSNYYRWTPAEGLSCTDCPDPALVLGTSTRYTLECWDDPTCPLTCIYNISTRKKQGNVFIPNIFSPNADGQNDFFEVFGTFFELKNMAIYDRWGSLLFQSNNTDARWDGTFQNKLLTPGVYVYKITYLDTYTNQVVHVPGTVTIVR